MCYNAHCICAPRFLFSGVVLLQFLGLVSGQSHPPPRYLFTFGDSYSATGFNHSSIQPGFFPDSPFGNPPFPGSTTCNGPGWVGTVVQRLSPPNTLSYNYAVIGATVNSSIVGPGAPGNNFVEQTSDFLAGPGSDIAKLSVPWPDYQSVFTVWFGINDINLSLQMTNQTSEKHAIFGDVLTNYFELMGSLYNAGARNFVLITVPPFQRSPQVVMEGASTVSDVAADITVFNSMLSSMVTPFVDAHANSTAWVIDSQPVFNTILDNPTRYGAPNASCYNYNGVDCLWWNNLHPGQAIQNAMGNAVYAHLNASGFYDGLQQWSAKSLLFWEIMGATGNAVLQ